MVSIANRNWIEKNGCRFDLVLYRTHWSHMSRQWIRTDHTQCDVKDLLIEIFLGVFSQSTETVALCFSIFRCFCKFRVSPIEIGNRLLIEVANVETLKIVDKQGKETAETKPARQCSSGANFIEGRLTSNNWSRILTTVPISSHRKWGIWEIFYFSESNSPVLTFIYPRIRIRPGKKCGSGSKKIWRRIRI
mgnify:CR=1 FL=1